MQNCKNKVIRKGFLLILVSLFIFVNKGQCQVFNFEQNPKIQDSDLLPIVVDGKWGFINKTGTVVINPQFYSVGLFSEGLAFVQLQISRVENNKTVEPVYGFIDINGKVVIKALFDAAMEFDNGLAAVCVGDRNDGKYYIDGKWGFIDKTGKFVIPPQFEQVTPFVEDRAKVKINGKWGYIDRAGQIVIKPQFKWAEDFSEGLAAVKSNGFIFDNKMKFIDKNGTTVIKTDLYKADSFNEGLAVIQIKHYGNEGYIDKSGKLVIEPKFNVAGNFKNGVARVRSEKETLCIDKTGKEVDWSLCEKNYFVEGLISFRLNGKVGFKDQTERIVIEPQWDLVTEFSGGIAAFVNFTKPGFQAGGIYIPGRLVINDALGKWGYIDKTGRCIWKQE